MLEHLLVVQTSIFPVTFLNLCTFFIFCFFNNLNLYFSEYYKITLLISIILLNCKKFKEMFCCHVRMPSLRCPSVGMCKDGDPGRLC